MFLGCGIMFMLLCYVIIGILGHAIIITTIIISIIIIMLSYDLYFLCIALIILLLGSLLKCVLARGTSERVSSG